MIRTQIQFTDAQASALRTMAAARNTSIAEPIRASADALMKREANSSREVIGARAKAGVGAFLPGPARQHNDLSVKC